jgi:hypothetical protein
VHQHPFLNACLKEHFHRRSQSNQIESLWGSDLVARDRVPPRIRFMMQ